jgi:hypothetical protein
LHSPIPNRPCSKGLPSSPTPKGRTLLLSCSIRPRRRLHRCCPRTSKCTACSSARGNSSRERQQPRWDTDEICKTFFVEPKAERIVRKQKETIEEWITGVTENHRHPLELYCQLTDDEFLYVQELQRVYDESRCYFVQWVIGKETKELVNSPRISVAQQGRKFTWLHVRIEILQSLTDVTLTARFLALSRLKRQNGSTAKLWISQVMTRRALLEDAKLLAPITLPETLYLELTVGQLSAQETTVFDCPCIGDDLNERGKVGRYLWTLDRLKRVVDQCSNPPAFHSVKMHITELLNPEPAKSNTKQLPRDKGASNPDSKRKLHTRAFDKTGHAEKPSKLPPHERPTIFPKGLKRLDLKATVDGHAIASEFQQKLSDDIVAGNCIRCHAQGHTRSACKDVAGRWETKFDNEKEKYWTGTLKWQQNWPAPLPLKPKAVVPRRPLP